MASDEEQIVARLERAERLDRRLRVERPGVADDQARSSGGWHGGGLVPVQPVPAGGAARPRQRSGRRQGERQRLATAHESIAHRPSA
jgi:hypothetical protein